MEKGGADEWKRINRLLRRENTEKELAIARNNYQSLKATIADIEKRNAVVEKKYSRDRLGLDMPIYSETDWKWMKEKIKTNPFRQEELKYTTGQGTKVRSKSEFNIVSRLEHHRLPYIYEMEFKAGQRIIYPDFTIRKRDGSIVIWEHFGLMDDGEYYKRAMEKILLYRRDGFVQNRNLICTWEEDIARVWAIDDIIKKFIFF